MNRARNCVRRLIDVGHRRAGWWFGQDVLGQIQHSRLPRYDDTIDAQRLSVDPVMRQEVATAPTSQVVRFDTDVLTYPHNLIDVES